ncbi:MAG: PKD domain-containing protein [Chitinophagaceae bacterium]
MKKIFFGICLFIFSAVDAQELTNLGTDFWTGFGYHARMRDNNTDGAFLSIYLSATQAATVRVSLPGLPAGTNGFPKTVIVPANTAVEVTGFPIGETGNELNTNNLPDSRLYYTGISKRAIHIESLNSVPVAAYEHTYGKDAAGASMIFPTNTWGASYNVLTIGGSTNSGISNSFFFVLAAEDNTIVDITPTADIQDSSGSSIFKTNGNVIKYPKIVAFSVTLQKGQVFNAMSTVVSGVAGDLTGTIIKSRDCVNKKIAVFAGNGRTFVNTSGCNVSSGSDNLLQQMLPRVAWGTRYLTTPTKTMEYGVYRICVLDPTTVVTVNGTALNPATLINNFYYQVENNIANSFSTDKPVMVTQFIITGGCKNNSVGNNGNGDPEMIILSPVQQAINNASVFSAARQAIGSSGASYINVVIRNQGINSFRLDGGTTVDTGTNSYSNTNIYGSSGPVAMANAFKTHPGDANYSYARFRVSSGVSHNLVSDSGFNAIAYGLSQGESYGYNAGTAIKDLTAIVTTQTPFGGANNPVTCRGNCTFVKISFPYLPVQVSSLGWDFGNDPRVSPNGNTLVNNPVPTTSFDVNGTTYYTYISPVCHAFNAVDTFPITVTATGTFSSECGSSNPVKIKMVVVRDTADFNFTATACNSNIVSFKDTSRACAGDTLRQWQWDFGDGSGSSTATNPNYTFATAAIFNVKLRTINNIGCFVDTTKMVDLRSDLQAKFGVHDSSCAMLAVSFSDSSSSFGIGGSIVKWYWDYGDGKKDTLTNGSSVTHTYLLPGTYTTRLKVETSGGCFSPFFTKTITVMAVPMASFSMPSGICLPGGATQFTNLSNISDGTGSTLKYSWNFGDGGTSLQKNPSHIYTSTGPFTITLSVSSGFGCSKDTIQILSNVYAQPKANFSVRTEACRNDTTIFTDLSDGKGNTVDKWRWNFGDGGTDTVQNPKHRYATAGTFTARLFVFTDKGCGSDTATKTTIINPLPTPQFIFSAPNCLNQTITFTDQSVGNAGTVTNRHWDLGNGTQHDFTNGNPFTETYAATGTYLVKLSVTSSKGCKSDTLVKQVMIRPIPVVGFILPVVCVNDAFAQFTDTSSIADNTSAQFTYLWNFGDANATVANPNTSTVKNPKHSYSVAGIYTVTLTVTSGNGCAATITKQLTVRGAPVSDFNVLTAGSICSNTAVQIQNLSTIAFGTISKIEVIWDYLNNPSAVVTDNTPTLNKIYSNAYPLFQAPVSKSFTIRMLSYSGAACVGVKDVVVTVNATPKLVFGFIPGICPDALPMQITQAVLSGGNIPGSFIYSGNGVSASGLFDPSIAGPGMHTIKAVYTSTSGCKDSASSSINVLPAPVAKFGISSPACESKDITFTDSSVAGIGKIYTWKWNFGDGTTAVKTTAAPFAKKFASALSYNVKLQVVSDSGCSSPVITKPVLVHASPIVDFDLPAGICLPNGVGHFTDKSTITDGTESQFNYNWSFGDGGTSTIKNATHTYANIGPFNVRLTIISKDGCSADSLRILNTILPEPKAGFTTTPAFVCLGDSISFADNSSGLTSAVTEWKWSFGDGVTDTTMNVVHRFGSAGTFNVSLFITNGQGCVSNTFTSPAIVYDAPHVDAGPTLYGLAGNSIPMQPFVTGNNLSFEWSPATFLDDASLKAPLCTPVSDILYTLTVTGEGGCKASDTTSVRLLQLPRIPNTFSPNGDGINDQWNIPNLNLYAGATVNVFDRYGKEIFKVTGYSKPWDGKANGKDLPVGTYYYIINPKNGLTPLSGSITILR